MLDLSVSGEDEVWKLSREIFIAGEQNGSWRDFGVLVVVGFCQAVVAV